MTDKEKIRKEVERLMNELIQEKEKGFGSDTDDACILELQNILTYIDSLQKEPVSKFDSCILPGDDVRYNEELGCRVNLSQLKRVAKKRSDSFIRITPDVGRSELIKLLNKGKLYTLKNNV